MCAQMLKHAIAHRGCMDTIRESALEVDSGRWNPHQYCALTFQSDAVPTELMPPYRRGKTVAHTTLSPRVG